MEFRKKIVSVICLSFLSLFSFGQKNEVDSLLKALKESSSDTQTVNICNQIAGIYNQESNPEAKSYSLKAIALSKEIGYDKGLATGYSTYAFAAGNVGDYADEISTHHKAIELFEKIKDTAALAKELGNLGIAEWDIGDYAPATDHSLQSIRLYHQLGNKFHEAVSYMTLGNIYFDEKNYQEALNCYYKARELNNDSEKTPMFDAGLLLDIGNIYNRKKLSDSAIYFYSQALPTIEKLGTPRQKSILLNNLGTVYEDMGEYETAMDYFKKCFAIRKTIGDSDGVCSVYQNFGNIYADLKNYDSAMYFYNSALGIATRMQSKSQEASIYNDMFSTYAEMGKYKEAYEYQSKYLAINDSIMGADNLNSVNELRARFDAEKRDAQINELEIKSKLDAEHSQRNIMMMLVILLASLLFASIIFLRYRSKKKTSEVLERQNAEITMQKKSITDSINYAKKIQDSILPPLSQINRVLPDGFILYEPKDVVSGDFYWLDIKDGLSIFAAVDCTGHGVPGALMSVIGFNLLNQAVNEMGITKPSDILHHLDFGVNKLLRQSDAGNTVKDGMDLGLCTYDPKTKMLQFAGVFNPAYIITKGELKIIQADKFPIGINTDGVTDVYTNNEIQMHSGDMVYLFSDGYADQFGGQMGKKFKYNRFREFLLKVHQLPSNEQQQLLKKEFLDWKGNLEQVDDILVIGLRVE